ncbi:unnamed protein product [Paramecium primaurelia]|uniref:Uncharacterized protein n=1 Tax=Paramecium primaurelia TaxID=5886 RepID=A0A8S1NQD4_PARPR|nr:unnamed protein product [Paramecium primaurelia]
MFNYQNDFGNSIWNDESYCQDDYFNMPQYPFQKYQSDDFEFYKQFSWKNRKNIEETNDDYKHEQQSNEFPQLNYATQKKNSFNKNTTHQIYSYQSRDDDQSEFKEDLLRKNRKKQILKLNVDSILPGESKNLPKCYARQLKIFIKNVFDQTEDLQLQKLKDDKDIRQFLQVEVEKLSKFELFKFIQTPGGSIFCKEFFGKCLWNFGIIKESKTNVNVLFRHNLEEFCQVIKKKKE